MFQWVVGQLAELETDDLDGVYSLDLLGWTNPTNNEFLEILDPIADDLLLPG